jgi:hypothetical protein
MAERNRICMLAVLLLLAAGSITPASATTVGDILSQRGTRLNKNEVAQLVGGATISGSQIDQPDTKFHVVYGADGSANGTYTSSGGWGRVSGKWTVNELGQFCSDLTNSYGGKIQRCSVVFRLGDRFFFAKSDSVTELAWERWFSKS